MRPIAPTDLPPPPAIHVGWPWAEGHKPLRECVGGFLRWRGDLDLCGGFQHRSRKLITELAGSKFCHGTEVADNPLFEADEGIGKGMIHVAVIQRGQLIPFGYEDALFAEAFRRMPFCKDYPYYVSAFSFRENYSIVFDHLLPQTARYIPRAEVLAWFERATLDNVIIARRTNNSWRGKGQKV